MKKLLNIALLGASALAMTGCAGGAKFVKAFGEDRAVATLNVGTPWGVQHVVRVGETTNTVIITPDGAVSINPPAK